MGFKLWHFLLILSLEFDKFQFTFSMENPLENIDNVEIMNGNQFEGDILEQRSNGEDNPQEDHSQLLLEDDEFITPNENDLRNANPEPHHHHKQKTKIHSHSHISTHVHGHGHGQVIQPNLMPMSNPIIPGTQQVWHQSQNIHGSLNNQHLGVLNHGYSQNILPNTGQFSTGLNHGTFQQNLHQTSSNLHNTNFLNQNNQFINGQNVNLNPGLSTVQIANLNGGNGAISQSSVNNNQLPIFSQRKTKGDLNIEDIRRSGDSGQEVKEEVDILPWYDNYGVEDQYDSEINSVLSALDTRSYLQFRPEVKVSHHFEKSDIPPEGSETPMESRQSCVCTYEKDEEKLPPSSYVVSDYPYRRKRAEETPYMNEPLKKTLEDYRTTINRYRSEIKDKDEMIFADFLDSIVADYENKNVLRSNDIKKVGKRAVPITKLLKDPNVKLDVPKTLENIGILTKNAFEDEKAPMFHVRNLMGSTKNAVLSAMRIPPQNFIVPSNYEIKNINPEEIPDELEENTGSINQNLLSRSAFDNQVPDTPVEYNTNNGDPYGIVDTFTRVGGAIRDSVKSGQNTLTHINDIAHNARKIFHTTKNSLPRVILPYARAPVLMSRMGTVQTPPPLKKTVIITPKVLDVRRPLLGGPNQHSEYVRMGNILDALGISKPDRNLLDLEKIVVKTPRKGGVRGIYIPPVGELKSVNGQELPQLKSRNAPHENVNSKSVKDVLLNMKNDAANALEKTKNQVNRMKNDIKNTLDENRSKNKDKEEKFLEKIYNNLDLNARNNDNENSLNHGKPTDKHYTKEEEAKIYDEFFNNLFKINDKNRDQKSPSNMNSKLKVLAKELTSDILNDEANMPMKSRGNLRQPEEHNVKKNTAIRKNIFLGNRFGGMSDEKVEEEITITLPPPNSALDVEEPEGNEEEAVRKVEEYVANDIVSSVSVPGLETEEPSEVADVDNLVVRTKRSPLDEDEDEIVGLNLPVELMKPFMARASDSEVKTVFKNDADDTIVGSALGQEKANIVGDSLGTAEVIPDYYPDSSGNHYDMFNGQYRDAEPVESFLCSSSPGNDDSPLLCQNGREPISESRMSQPETEDEMNGSARTSMVVNENLRKPFMGMGSESAINSFYDEFNSPDNNEEIFNSNLFTDDS